jgi:hypothetical protein
MSAYSKEYALGPKARAQAALKQLAADIQSGVVQMSGNEPKMTLRVLRSLSMSTDETFQELVTKWDKGEITTEQLKNKGRTLIETKKPKPLRRIPTDRIHHGTPLEIAAILEDLPPEELHTVLQHYEKQDVFFADSDPNIRGGSFDEREHTGARPKASKSKTVYPNEYGPPGVTSISGHPRGTRDPFYNRSDRPTTATDAIKLTDELLKQNAIDQDLARQVAKPRRDWINNKLVEQGLIDEGVDIFSANTDDATLKRVAPYLQNPDIQRAAAEAFETPIRVEKGVVRYNSFDPISAVMPTIMRNRIASLTGIFFDAYDRETISKFESGDVLGGSLDVATAATTGAVVGETAKRAGASKLLGTVAAPIQAAGLISEGREGSLTTELVNKYGPNVGMNQERPSWGTEFGEMQTQKPGYVQATEDALDWVGGKAIEFGKGIARYVGGGVQQKEEERKESTAPYLPNIR